MDFAIEDTPEQSAFRAEVRAWLAKNVSSRIEHSVDPCDMSLEQYQLRRDLGRRLGAQGWLYPNMPKEYGGGDLAAEKTVILYDEITRLGLALPPYYDAGGRMSAPTILVWGTEEHKKRFLPPICRGEVRTWQLLTEPGAGSDLAGVKTTAIRDGDVYVVNGQKVFVGSSHGADYSWTIVVTDPKGERHKNLSPAPGAHGLGPGRFLRSRPYLQADRDEPRAGDIADQLIYFVQVVVAHPIPDKPIGGQQAQTPIFEHSL